MLSLMPADLVDRADIGMIEGGSSLGFPLEAFQYVAIFGYRFREELQGDEATQASPTSAGFGAESFVYAGLAFLSVTISGCLPRFDGPHDLVGDPENFVDLALYRIGRGSFSQSQRRSLGGW